MNTRPLRIFCCTLMCLVASGCISTMRGTPERPFEPGVVTDKATLERAVLELSSGALDGTDKKIARDKEVSKLLSAVDANYFEFRKDVRANSRHSSAASGMLTLLMTIAGGLTESAGVKNHYLLGTNLVGGTSTQFQKSYLYESNIAALIAKMDADRDKTLAEIMNMMEDNAYRGHLALLNVHKYFVKGTLESAVTSIEKAATEDARNAAAVLNDKALRNELKLLDAERIKRVESARE